MPLALDNAAFYEAQTICDPTPRPGATGLQNLLLATYGPATIYIPRSCTSSTSEHFDGRAVDWMRSVRVPAEKEMADAFVAWLLAPAADGTPHEMARRLGIMYIIWDSRMIRMYDPGRGWTEYNNCLDPARSGTSLDTTCHRNHVHMSMSWDGAAGITSWWTGAAQTQPYCPAMSTRATPGTGAGLVVPDLSAVPGAVPVTPTAILDTRAGRGRGAHRLVPEPRRPLAVPDCRGRRAGTRGCGCGRAAGHLVEQRPRHACGVVLGLTTASRPGLHPHRHDDRHRGRPLASDGSVALGTSLGAANLSATVIGYAPGSSTFAVADPAPPPPPEPIARPSKPRSVAVKSSRRAVTTRWKAPSRPGGAAVTGYRVEALMSSKRGAAVAGSCSAAPEARSCTIKGLKKGRKYWMSVSVANPGGATWAPRKKVRVR